VSRPQWTTRSAAERLNAAHRRWNTPTTEQATKTENTIGVLHFNANGEKQVSRLSRNEIDKRLSELTDPSNYAGRVADAQAIAAATPLWAGTTGCNPRNETERRALADAQAAAGRDLRYSEKQIIIDRLRQR